ncbi:MAG: NADH-quinone oxidoreductase subunit M, partial [Candidatus Hinthialibacter sp.]
MITFIPLLGAILILAAPKTYMETVKWTALAASAASLALCVPLLIVFPYGEPGFHLAPPLMSWIPALGIDYRIGVDGLSLILVVLTALL